MNKVLFSLLFAFFGAVILTSCSEEVKNYISDDSSEITEVNFVLSLESRDSSVEESEDEEVPVGMGGKITQLYLQVTDGQGHMLDCTVYDSIANRQHDAIDKIISIPNPDINDFHKYRLILPIGVKNYKIAFWAQHGEAATVSKPVDQFETRPLFDLSEFPVVKIDYQGALNNDDTRDAFYALVENTPQDLTDKVKKVIFKRPFAQINLGSVYEDFNASRNELGIEILKTSMETNSVANRLNIVEKKAWFEDSSDIQSLSDEEEITDPYKFKFESTDIFPEEGVNETLIYSSGTEDNAEDFSVSRWLSMSYILPAGDLEQTDKASTVDLKFTLKGFQKEEKADAPDIEDDIDIDIQDYSSTIELRNVPVRDNHQTNIVGWIITAKPRFYINLSSNIGGNSTSKDLE